MKKKLLLTSILTVIMCLSLICGATFALFTSESNINIAVQAANVEVNAIVKENSITTKSFDNVVSENALEGTFENGGTAKFTDTATLKLDLLTPGDEVSFMIDVENESNVKIKYRVEMVATGELAPALVGSANIQNQDYAITAGVTKWFSVDAGVEIPDIAVTVAFPDAQNNNDYKGKTANIEFAIVAVQGNASVVDVNTNGTMNTDTEITDAKGNSAKVPAGALLNGFTLTLNVSESNEAKTGNFNFEDNGNTAYPFNVSVDGIKDEKDDPTDPDEKTNEKAIVVTMKAPAGLDGVTLFHEGEKMILVASADEVDAHHEYFYDKAGSITFATKNFSNFTLVDVLLVSTAEELVIALEDGDYSEILFYNDIKIDPANMSNAYGTTGINIKKNQTLNGGGFVLDVQGAGGTWDSGINITGGTIKNITVTGSFRGIFINHGGVEDKVYLENVIIKGTTYTISCDQGSGKGLEATNCTFNGWTSFAATLGEAKFVNCTFGEGSGYAYCRPYATTKFVNCTFEEGYKMDARGTVVLDKCYLGEEEITADNLATLVISNTANASVVPYYNYNLTEDVKSTDEKFKEAIKNNKISDNTNIDLAGNTFEATGTIELKNDADLSMKDGDYVVNGTYGHIDARPSTAEGSVLNFENVNFSFNKLGPTYGPSTNRLGSVVEVCATVADAKTVVVFKNCTFTNAQVLFEGMSGKTGEFEATFENCTFNALTSSAPIYVQNYVKGTINVIGCTFNIEATSSTASAISVSSSSSTTVTVNAKDNTFNVVAATPTDSSVTGVDVIKVNGTPANVKFISAYENTTVNEENTTKTGIAG